LTGTDISLTDDRRLAADDYKKMEIPHIILASNGEDEKIVKECRDILVGGGKPGVVETYGTMHHVSTSWSTFPLHALLHKLWSSASLKS